MGISDLFKSTEQRKLEERRRTRKMQREAERLLDDMGDRIKLLEKQRTDVWNKALHATKAGQKMEAARLVQQFKAYGVLISRLDKQRIVAQSRLTGITTAGDVGTLTSIVSTLAKSLNIDPTRVEMDLDQINEVSEDVAEVNKVVDKAYERDVDRVAMESEKMGAETADEELMAALEREAAAEVSAGKVVINIGNEKESEVGAIDAGVARLNARLAKLDGIS
jgi:hypothetical protein